MEPVAFFLIGFFLISIVLGPIFGAESRREWLRPDLRRREPRVVDQLAVMRLRQSRRRP